MTKLNMQGPYALDAPTIDKEITKTSSGNYALGNMNDKNNNFIVEYVGRADKNLNKRLKEWIDTKKYSKFKFSYALSSKDAFEKECNNFHDFGESKSLDNDIHPDRPDGTNYQCPQCDNFKDK